jgi:hypothetical protein
MNDMLDGGLCDEEGNLTPEVAQRISNRPGVSSTRGVFDELMDTMVQVPAGVLLFLVICTFFLFIAFAVSTC